MRLIDLVYVQKMLLRIWSYCFLVASHVMQTEKEKKNKLLYIIIVFIWTSIFPDFNDLILKWDLFKSVT